MTGYNEKNRQERESAKSSGNFLFVPRHFNDIPLWKEVTDRQWSDPQWQKKNSIRTVEHLKQVINLTPYQADEIRRTLRELKKQGKEPLRITPYYASLMDADPFHPVMLSYEKGKNRLDPVFWQSVPTPANLMFPDTGAEGAMCEGSRSFGAVYQRYPNRVALFVAENTSCASYCVHCQRAKSLDGTTEVTIDKINRGLFYIGYNRNIDEVLVTGGDALMISRNRLRYILEELSRIPHLRAIRIATRVPVVMPMGITGELLESIASAANRYTRGLEKHVYFMTHINHYREITGEFAAAVKRIRLHGFTLRNQTVFLNHVNDYYKTLAETFRRMLWVGVHPYYLLQCHKEKGLVHFIAPIQIGKLYMKHLQGWLSGITLPKYAANVEGGGGKIILMPSGHDTLNLEANLESKISESYATVNTWDSRELYRYEALGRATREEFNSAVASMEKFIGRKNAFFPKVIIIDEKGNHLFTTNRIRLPRFAQLKKALQLHYEVEKDGMPCTNPSAIRDTLEADYQKSKFTGTGAASGGTTPAGAAPQP